MFILPTSPHPRGRRERKKKIKIALISIVKKTKQKLEKF